MLGSKQLMYPKSLLICEGGHEFSCFNIKINEINAFISKYTANIIRNIEKQKKMMIQFLLLLYQFNLVQFTSLAQSCPTLCEPMKCSTPGLPVHHQLPELTQTRVHWVGDVIQLSHPLSTPSPHALNFLQHQGLFHWVSSSHQVAKVLEFQLPHQSFQWTPRTDLL